MCPRIRCLVLVALMVIVLGCKKRTVQDEKVTTEDQLKALVETQAQQAKTLEQYRAEIVAWRNTAMAQAAEPEFRDDLAVAKRLASELSRQASKQQEKESVATVDRLVRCLAYLVAEAPASRILQHLERAEMHLTSGSLEEASREVLAAAGTAYNPTAPALVPEVLSQLEQAGEAVRTGDATKAQELISAVMEKARADQTTADLAAAHAIALDAAISLQRKAWTILIAQSAQIGTLLQTVEKRATPEARTEAASAAQAEKTAPAEPAPKSSLPAEGTPEASSAQPENSVAPKTGGTQAQPTPSKSR